MKIVIFSAFLCLTLPFAFGMRQQAVAVKGILKCGNAPASNVHVKVNTITQNKRTTKIQIRTQNEILFYFVFFINFFFHIYYKSQKFFTIADN